jgi:hypothetical protein
MKRVEAYAWLAGEMGRAGEAVHIGEMNEAECEFVIRAAQRWMVEDPEARQGKARARQKGPIRRDGLYQVRKGSNKRKRY